MVRRREFDHCAVSNDWFGWYQKAKKEAPAGEYRMSEVTWTLLNSSFDYERISKQRVHNYNFLADELGELALRPDLPDGVVPLGFPIRVSNREQVTRKLYDARIYPAVHWDVKGVVSGDFQPSLQLSGEIMTLPCDQRYTPSDLSGMVSIIQQHGLSR
jgi:dTDP-4-amino-4,6-dideoxygalactose transaminase